MDCSSITDFQQSTAIRIAKKFRNLHIGYGQKVTPFFWAQNFGFWPKNPIFAIQPQFWSMTHF